MLELVREGNAPAAILMGKADAILSLGVVVGRELGYASVPMFEVSVEDQRGLTVGAMVSVTEDGTVTQA
jgi:predicted aconitase with swiveling domain